MKKRILSLALAILMLATVATLFTGCSSSSVDYVSTVKSVIPYEDQGISATYGTVLNKYITSCTWTDRVQSKDLVYVDASGKITDTDGTEIEVAITFKVTPYEGKTEGQSWVEPQVLEISSNSYQQAAASEFVDDLFNTYAAELGSVANYYQESGIDGIAQYYSSQYN